MYWVNVQYVIEINKTIIVRKDLAVINKLLKNPL